MSQTASKYDIIAEAVSVFDKAVEDALYGDFYEVRGQQMAHRHCERCHATQCIDPEMELTQCSVCGHAICTLCVLSDSDEPVRCVECEKDYQRSLYTYYEMSLGVI